MKWCFSLISDQRMLFLHLLISLTSCHVCSIGIASVKMLFCGQNSSSFHKPYYPGIQNFTVPFILYTESISQKQESFSDCISNCFLFPSGSQVLRNQESLSNWLFRWSHSRPVKFRGFSYACETSQPSLSFPNLPIGVQKDIISTLDRSSFLFLLVVRKISPSQRHLQTTRAFHLHTTFWSRLAHITCRSAIDPLALPVLASVHRPFL